MPLLSDVKSVSEKTIDQLAEQFGDLPRPLLAAIGAGDATVERLARLRQQVQGRVADRGDAASRDTATTGHAGEGAARGRHADSGASDTDGGDGSADDEPSLLGDLAGRAQRVAGDTARGLQELASQAPERAQKLIGELPDKARDVTASLSPENLRSTLESYTQSLARAYEHLADRGDEAMAKRRADSAGGAGGDDATDSAGGADATDAS